jgi:hypothetical protein
MSNVQTPIGYHYAIAPTCSVDAVRKAVFTNFDISTCTSCPRQMKAEGPLIHSSRSSNPSLAPAGIPGNDDQAAMATWLIWHLLGLYPGLLGSSPKPYSLKAHITLTLLYCTTAGIHHRQKSPWHERAPHSLANDTQVYSTQPISEHKHNRDRRRLRRPFRARDNPARRGGVRAERARERRRPHQQQCHHQHAAERVAVPL